MKKLLLRRPVCIVLIFAVVFGGYGLFLLFTGRELSMYVNYDAKSTLQEAEVRFGEAAERAESDIFEVKSVKIRNGYVKAEIRSKTSGTEKVSLKAGTVSENGETKKNIAVSYVKAGALGIITNNPYQHIYAVLSVLCFLLFCYYVFCFVNAVKTRRFSYDTVFFLSVALFFAMLLCVWGGASVYSFTQYHTTSSQMVYSVNQNLMTMLVFATLPFMFVFVLSVSVSNAVLMKKEGFRPANALGIITSAVMLVGLAVLVAMYLLKDSYYPKILSAVYAAASSLYIFFEIVLLSSIAYGIYVSKHTPEYNKDFIIILGCMIKPDGTLYPLIRGRADKAVEFYEKQLENTGKAACFIPSGGQGDDEIMPEAEAMKNYLISRGIPEDRIIPETASATTKENMEFSKKIIDGKTENAEVIFSTTSYHVLRSGAIAYSNGINIDGIGSRTKWYFWPNAFLREVAGIFVNQPKKQLVITLLIALSAGFGSYIYSLL